jgi:all-trans-retinol 13,14-reductase
MRFDEVSRWQHTHIEARGEAYEAFKRQKAETLIRALEEEVPGIGSCIDTYYTSTPLTYQHYTSTPQGTMYGLAKDVNLFASGNMSPRTSIPNLLLAGQSIASHGMLGVLAGSLLACSEVIPREKLFRQLHEASNVQ